MNQNPNQEQYIRNLWDIMCPYDLLNEFEIETYDEFKDHVLADPFAWIYNLTEMYKGAM